MPSPRTVARVTVGLAAWALFVYLAVRAAELATPTVLATSLAVLAGAVVAVGLGVLVSVFVRHDREWAIVEAPPEAHDHDSVGRRIEGEPDSLREAQVIVVSVSDDEKAFVPATLDEVLTRARADEVARR